MKKFSFLWGIFLIVSMLFIGCAKAENPIQSQLPSLENITVTISEDGVTEQRELNGEESTALKNWIDSLTVTPRTYPDGQAPNQVFAGGISYEFNINHGDFTFTYLDIDKTYLYLDGNWYQIEASETMPIEREEAPVDDRIPMVMVNGKLYYDTGKESTIEGRCGTMDGEITSSVDSTEIPTEDNQSNFGTGFGYQYTGENTIEIYLNNKWIIFEHRSGSGSQIRFGDAWYNLEDLSPETIAWLDWYNGLSEEEQLAVSSIPPELVEKNDSTETQDAPAEEPSSDPLGLSLHTQNVTPTGLTLMISQSGGNPTGSLQTGAYYEVEKKENHIWTPVTSLQDMAWDDIAYHIPENKTTTFSLDWQDRYGSLPVGSYRIKIEIMDFRDTADFDTYPYYAEFEMID